ncbi:MAG: T9SS type A sorting domain-containing protein [Candidatus Eisenbacteria bacterium]|uniref:T9SS type A sorting domain-containing protein n=1 Tax=Eiseniibacteriota bacterium TaxID=2212470 RepID=A0A9D6L752_UNCEI|nr:T9SS type A sorting domain-containing protein [Candidatus Eisenbacteria bacterium]MBI3538845.1 T9SS type A sorting domain-containing protein [Candidatus Eisenbacteria bacterium]
MILSAVLFTAASACDLPVCTAPRSQDNPHIVSDGAGGAIIVWHDTRNPSTNPDIYAQHITAGLAIDPIWPVNGAPVTAAPGSQDVIDVAPDGAGGVFVVWEDDRKYSASQYDIYGQHITASGTVAAGWPTDGLALCAATGDQRFPRVVSDGSGGLIAVWEDHRGPDADIYGMRVNGNGTAPLGWLLNGNPVCTAPKDQVEPALMADGAGGAIVVWADARSDPTGGGDVYAGRILANGGPDPAWPNQGSVLSAFWGPQGAELHLVTDGVGGAIVGWVDYSASPSGDIYAQRVSAAGVVPAGWPANGFPVCTAPSGQFNLDMISDESGGALFVWDDYRNATNSDLYGHHILANGTMAPGWIANGNLVATGPDYQVRGSLAKDKQGGMYTAFDVDNPTDHDICVQHMMGNGMLASGWPATGKPECIGPADDDEARAVSDGAGGMIVASFHADAQVNGDIYAFWVRPDLPVATLVSLVSDEAQPDQVALSWYGAQAGGLAATVERRTTQSDWTTLANISADGSGTFRCDDRSVAAGTRYGYRLSYHSGAEALFTFETWVDVPKPVLALYGLRPNPAIGECVASFSLAENRPAMLEVFDVTGRKVISQEVGGLGMGAHRLRLDQGVHFAAGVYALRLIQGNKSLTARAVVVR